MSALDMDSSDIRHVLEQLKRFATLKGPEPAGEGRDVSGDLCDGCGTATPIAEVSTASEMSFCGRCARIAQCVSSIYEAASRQDDRLAALDASGRVIGMDGYLRSQGLAEYISLAHRSGILVPPPPGLLNAAATAIALRFFGDKILLEYPFVVDHVVSALLAVNTFVLYRLSRGAISYVQNQMKQLPFESNSEWPAPIFVEIADPKLRLIRNTIFLSARRRGPLLDVFGVDPPGEVRAASWKPNRSDLDAGFEGLEAKPMSDTGFYQWRRDVVLFMVTLSRLINNDKKLCYQDLRIPMQGVPKGEKHDEIGLLVNVATTDEVGQVLP